MDAAGKIVIVLNQRHAEAWRRRGHDLAPSATVRETCLAEEGTLEAEGAAEDGAAMVVAAGGDGTIRSVAEGLLAVGASRDERPVLGLIPLGHGNDLTRALAERPVDTLDVGRVTVDGLEGVFVNSVGIGLEGRVATAVWRAPRVGYTAAALGAVLFGRRSWALEGTLDDALFSRTVSVFSIGNSHSTGGGYRLTPDARTDDGLLDYCALAGSTRRRLLAFMRRARRGTHLDRPDVESGRFRRLVLRASPGVPIHADGEVIAGAAREIVVELLPAALRVRLPG